MERSIERNREREGEGLWHFGAICFVCIWDTLNVIDTCYVNALGCPKSQSPLPLRPPLAPFAFPSPELSVLVATLRFYLSARHFVCLFAFALFLLYAVSLFILWQRFFTFLSCLSYAFFGAPFSPESMLWLSACPYTHSLSISLFPSLLAAGIDSLPILMKCRQLKCLPASPLHSSVPSCGPHPHGHMARSSCWPPLPRCRVVCTRRFVCLFRFVNTVRKRVVKT